MATTVITPIRKNVMTLGDFITELEKLPADTVSPLCSSSFYHMNSEKYMTSSAVSVKDKWNLVSLANGDRRSVADLIKSLKNLNNPSAFILSGGLVDKIAPGVCLIPSTAIYEQTSLNTRILGSDLVHHLNANKISDTETIIKLAKDVNVGIVEMTLVGETWYLNDPPHCPAYPKIALETDWKKLFIITKETDVLLYKCRIPQSKMDEEFGPKKNNKSKIDLLMENVTHLDDDGRQVEICIINGCKEVKRTRNGKLDGPQELFDVSTGDILELKTYKDDIKDGPYAYYHSGGKIWMKFSYKDGKLDGLEEHFTPSGMLIVSTHYKEGRWNGLRTEYKGGKPVHTTLHKDGIPHGEERFFDDNGNVTQRIVWENGKQISNEDLTKPNLVETTPGRFNVKGTNLLVEKLSDGKIIIVDTTDKKPADKDLATRLGFILIS